MPKDLHYHPQYCSSLISSLSSSYICMELGHLLTHSSLTYPEVSSKICHNSFCQLGNSVSLPWVIYYEAFYIRVHVVLSFSCIQVICPKLGLLLTHCGRVTQICAFTLQLCKTDDANLRF